MVSKSAHHGPYKARERINFLLKFFWVFEARYLAALKANLDASESVASMGAGRLGRSFIAVVLEDMLNPRAPRRQIRPGRWPRGPICQSRKKTGKRRTDGASLR
jgi:hypothetical protein